VNGTEVRRVREARGVEASHSWTSASCSGSTSRPSRGRGSERAGRVALSYLSQGLPEFRGDLPEWSPPNRPREKRTTLGAFRLRNPDE
jgi:hypothetical protein